MPHARRAVAVITALAVIGCSSIRAGLVRVTAGPDGKPFDWKQISGGFFRVYSGPSEPDRAFVQVQHRGYWFWIDDADLEAKGTFTLLNQLFSLQAASDKIQALC